tara:strand:- start:558 stop:2573 length:2016 start_codon:yes stop_codon:yes gene_type:complete
MNSGDYILLAATGLVILAIAGAAITRKAGAPLLLIFLGLGMLTGTEGPGPLQVEAEGTAYLFGSLALALILFDGGLRTKLRRLKGVLRPSLTLATVGVMITAAITAVAAHYLFDLGWIESLLMGAIVSSTDAAAVLMLIAGSDVKARPRVATTLEAESGFNDPMAVILVVTLVEWLVRGGPPNPALAVLAILWALFAGGLIGWFGGRAIAWVERRIGLPIGLYPIFAVASAMFLFALAQSLEASGFLAAYLAGVAFTAAPERRAGEATTRFSDGMAWLAQIGLFLMLGLMVTPSHAVAVALPALGIALVLIFLARPLAVLVCLLPEKYRNSERAFIAWMGLRGATPIFLGSFPVIAGVENANLYFSAAFAVVIASLVIQGWTAGSVSRMSGIAPQIKGQGRLRNAGSVMAVVGGFAGVTLILSVIFGVRDSHAPILQTASVGDLRELVDNAVGDAPRLRLAGLPDDWSDLPTAERRRLFTQIVAGLVEETNQRILADRRAIRAMQVREQAGESFSLPEQGRRDTLARRYGGRYGDLDDLMARADIIPPSLAVAQAVIATGWGSSPAAQTRNALFGRFPAGSFDSLSASAQDYVDHLNSHPAFAAFRIERAALRAAGEPVTGTALAPFVGPYVADGPAYIAQVEAILNGPDGLERFDPVPSRGTMSTEPSEG